jgi:D-sedoheptulose 7-phosphate isomerase
MAMSMDHIITDALKQNLSVTDAFITKNASKLVQCAKSVSAALTHSRKLMICGNGGSAADAQHIAAEFVNRLRLERRPLPAMALTTDSSIITSVANDYGYENVFSKQIEALGVEGDILLAISTSGRSPSILSAVRAAKQRSLYTVGLIGGDGGAMLGLVDLPLHVESDQTPRVQEAHILAGHLICELVEYTLFTQHSPRPDES